MASLRILIVGCLLLLSAKASTEFSKEQAYQALKKNGFRWKQIAPLIIEAQGLTQQASAANSFHLGFATREYIARINQIEFGFADPGPLGLITLGSTGLQFSMNLIDTAAKARLKAAQENEKLTQENVKQHQLDLSYVMFLTFLNTQRLKKKIDAVNSSLKKDLDILKIAKARVDMGQGLRIDLLRARALFEKDNLKKLDATSSYLKSKSDLAVLLGADEIGDDIEDLQIKNKVEQPKNPDSLLQTITDRPDVMSAKHTVLASSYLKEQAVNESHIKLIMVGDTGVFGTHFSAGQRSRRIPAAAVAA